MSATIIATRDGAIDESDRSAFQSILTGLSGKKIWLHLHGGLVPEGSGREIAERLRGAAEAGGFGLKDDWTQIYVVWRTGAFETLKANWTDLFENDRLYKAILKRLIEFVAGKVGLRDQGGRAIGQHFVLTPQRIRELLDARPDHDPFQDVEDVLSADGGGRGPMVSSQDDFDLEEEFKTLLSRDIDFNDAVEDLASAVTVQAGRAQGAAGDAEAGLASLARLDAEIQRQVTGALPTEPGARLGSLAVAHFLLKHGGRIAVRCIQRFRARRQHGLYPTIVEELARECYGDLIGATIWGMMKKDAGDHFKPEGLGSALLAACAQTQPKRLAVTAHSAGSIWVAAMLKAAPPTLAPLDLALLAPAVRMDVFADALATSSAKIRRCRMFTMKDELEVKDPVLGKGKAFIYPCSLLYLVSGLFEEQKRAGNMEAFPDAPILGMQRFHLDDGAWLKDPDQIAARTRVLDFFKEPNRSILYARASGGLGESSDAASHGAFDTDKQTLASVVHFLS